MKNKPLLKEWIKKAIRDAFIGKHYMVTCRRSRYAETEGCDVEHLLFREREMVLIGQYDRPFGYFTLEYQDVLELADNGYVERTYNRGEMITFIHRIEEKEGQQ